MGDYSLRRGSKHVAVSWSVLHTGDNIWPWCLVLPPLTAIFGHSCCCLRRWLGEDKNYVLGTEQTTWGKPSHFSLLISLWDRQRYLHPDNAREVSWNWWRHMGLSASKLLIIQSPIQSWGFPKANDLWVAVTYPLVESMLAVIFYVNSFGPHHSSMR